MQKYNTPDSNREVLLLDNKITSTREANKKKKKNKGRWKNMENLHRVYIIF
jgi:hypothetical protein